MLQGIIFVALIIAAFAAFDAYLYRTSVNKKDALLASERIALSQEETKRLAIFLAAISNSTVHPPADRPPKDE